MVTLKLQELVVAVNLVKIYRDGTKAVDNISYKAGKGITVLMGPNGSGKTTTLSITAGALKPTSGKVYICGHDLWGKGWYEARTCISFAPQEMPFEGRLTALENLIHIGLMRGMSLRESRKRALSLLEEMGLKEAKDKLVNKLSGGMRRRLTIAGCLMGNPQVLIMDEPTSGLDPSGREELWSIIKEMGRDRVVLVSTHIPEEAEEYADNVLVFYKGKIVGEGPPNLLIEKYAPESVIEIEGRISEKIIETYPEAKIIDKGKLVVKSKNPDETLPGIIQEIVKIGGRVSHARVRKPGLREVYFALTGEYIEER